MGIILMFMLLSTVTPFLFIRLRKPSMALAQTVLLVGMWVYYFQVLFFTVPVAFSPTWIMFYLGLVGAWVAWVMFIITTVEESPAFKETIKDMVKS
ncbi:hypothetical protein LCM20_01215 [Halobacillus litoralis]|uniref:hypothetical protein n=1 Tax=Halobacillus litoralis TaxID=45668 RepID=UPI001CD6AFDF|nr:hypothetical protein [Halobacillus litoralis]MCA0969204.1 hypothetical protein [Halobacillus litoralis]